MQTGFTIGYMNFTVILFLLTGGALLWFDVQGYRHKGMNKEEKAARFLGWINIAMGGIGYVGYWIYGMLL
ncbi:CLC_0170 family protein [Paenibacillus hamazuiensis]|uniref:CLC_0170 family protein n=1 Tax=Paenibacillus hamazuiensis TaxID=2936508 RepID=UPI0020101162|nr:CLC_0170 family protein [Paenibacillus hamazuiensis]